jgi:hypothetical protein
VTNLMLFSGQPAVNSPCMDCPWRRDSSPGWLGPYTAQEWIEMAHSDVPIACHRTIATPESGWDGALQCAGSASFRANVAKSPRDPRVAQQPPRDDVFQSNAEFIDHHEGRAS